MQIPQILAFRHTFHQYDAQAALAWAYLNNWDDGNYYGTMTWFRFRRRWCTNYVAGALAAGGLDTSRVWSGNQFLIRWMCQYPTRWQFVTDVDQLEPGDFILFTNQPDARSGTGSTGWNTIHPTLGTSLWNHVALLVARHRIAEWNPERWAEPYEAVWPTQPKRRFVHILRCSSPL